MQWDATGSATEKKKKVSHRKWEPGVNLRSLLNTLSSVAAPQSSRGSSWKTDSFALESRGTNDAVECRNIRAGLAASSFALFVVSSGAQMDLHRGCTCLIWFRMSERMATGWVTLMALIYQPVHLDCPSVHFYLGFSCRPSVYLHIYSIHSKIAFFVTFYASTSPQSCPCCRCILSPKDDPLSLRFCFSPIPQQQRGQRD